MNQVRIRESIKAGWGSFVRRPWYLVGLMFAFIAIFIISVGNAVATALSYIAYGGYTLMLIKHFRGEHVKFDDMFDIDNRWISFSFLGIIKMILISLGFLCFIIPGIYLAVRWMFAEFLVLDQGMKPLEALKASSKMTEGVRWKLFLFIVVIAVMCILSVLALIVGAFVAGIVATFAMIKLYEDLKGKLNESVMTDTV